MRISPRVQLPPRKNIAPQLQSNLLNIAHRRMIDYVPRSAVNILSLANAALGEHRRQGTDGIIVQVCLIGSRLFCLRVEPTFDIVKATKIHQAVVVL